MHTVEIIERWNNIHQKIEIIRNIDFIERQAFVKRGQIGLFSVINRYDLGYNYIEPLLYFIQKYRVICPAENSWKREKKSITCGTLLSLIVNRSV